MTTTRTLAPAHIARHLDAAHDRYLARAEALLDDAEFFLALGYRETAREFMGQARKLVTDAERIRAARIN